MAELSEEKLQERREERRKRRKRNQLLAYLTVCLAAVFVIAGVTAVCVHLIKISGHKETPPQEETPNDAVADLFGGEQDLEKPEETETETELTEQQKLDAIIDAAIEVMPLEDKVAGLFIVTPEAITGVSTAIKAGDGTKDALNQYAVGGLIYFEKNIRSADQITEMLSNTLLYSKYPLFLAVDEEGGKVSRLASAGLVDNVGSAGDIGDTADPANAYAAGQIVAGYMTGFGFNLDLGPVADIENEEGSFIGQRSYGSDSSVVSSMVVSMVTGLEENGVSSCLKHFPGMGSCTQDPHTGLATTERTLEQFEAEEFETFRAGIEAGADFVMVSHIAAPGLTGDNTPCSLSDTVVTDYLRKELGFEGIIITDAMNMGAITEYYEAGEAAVLALRAGCDMILMPDDFELAYQSVLEAVQSGAISEERINDSLRRIYRIKYADKLSE